GADGKPALDEKGRPKLGRRTRLLSERRFIAGHVLTDAAPKDAGHGDAAAHHEGPRLEGEWAKKSASIPYVSEAQIDRILAFGQVQSNDAETFRKNAEANAENKADWEKKAAAKKAVSESHRAYRKALLEGLAIPSEDAEALLKPDVTKETKTAVLAKINSIYLHEIDIENANPHDPDNDSPRFELSPKSKEVHGFKLDKQDLLPGHGAWVPRLNTYLASYFMITGLHGAHVLGGSLVFIYFWLNIKGGSKLYHTNHQQLVNRIEVAGLFWHLVDLIWIFVFPIFYLL
ncbi:MAG: cytochrome c oxidase subunit 3, partial [Bradyrhizobium sp.]